MAEPVDSHADDLGDQGADASRPHAAPAAPGPWWAQDEPPPAAAPARAAPAGGPDRSTVDLTPHLQPPPPPPAQAGYGPGTPHVPQPPAGHAPPAPAGWAPQAPAGYAPQAPAGYAPQPPAGYAPQAAAGYTGQATAPPAPQAPAHPAPPLPADASEFTPQRMLKRRRRAPSGGWRRTVYKASGGHVSARPSRAQRERQDLARRSARPILGSRRIAVISRKGGVGKTTTALMLGHLFAAIRGDRVIAVDGNPDAGTLGYRLTRQTTATISDLLRAYEESGPQGLTAYAQVRAFTSQAPSRLEVLASDDDPHMARGFGARELVTALDVLERHYNLVLLDTGTGVLDSATRGCLAAADQLVVVAAPSLDSARAASLTLDWLNENGFRDLVTDAVAVVNGDRDLDRIEIGRVEDHFVRRCRAVVRIPWDPHLEAGAVSNPDLLGQSTRTAYLRLAAGVADGFDLPSHRQLQRPSGLGA